VSTDRRGRPHPSPSVRARPPRGARARRRGQAAAGAPARWPGCAPSRAAAPPAPACPAAAAPPRAPAGARAPVSASAAARGAARRPRAAAARAAPGAAAAAAPPHAPAGDSRAAHANSSSEWQGCTPGLTNPFAHEQTVLEPGHSTSQGALLPVVMSRPARAEGPRLHSAPRHAHTQAHTPLRQPCLEPTHGRHGGARTSARRRRSSRRARLPRQRLCSATTAARKRAYRSRAVRPRQAACSVSAARCCLRGPRRAGSAVRRGSADRQKGLIAQRICTFIAEQSAGPKALRPGADSLAQARSPAEQGLKAPGRMRTAGRRRASAR